MTLVAWSYSLWKALEARDERRIYRLSLPLSALVGITSLEFRTAMDPGLRRPATFRRFSTKSLGSIGG